MGSKDESQVKRYPSPIPKGVKTRIVYPGGEAAHERYPVIEYAKDFLVPVETKIKAMEGGEVIFVKSDSDEYGLGKEFAEKVNIVAVRHEDGTAIEYCHMGKDKIFVKVGDTVKTGDVLGLSGLSGSMDVPHLHANRFRYDDEGVPKSVPYDVEGVKDERATNKGQGGLERVAVGIFIISIGIVLLFFSGITGNVVGVVNNSFYSVIFIFVSLISGGSWLFLKNNYKNKRGENGKI